MATALLPSLIRPFPPSALLEDDAHAAFRPAPDVWRWIKAAFLDEGSPLFNEEHSHLGEAIVGVLWTNVDNVRQQRTVVGMAEMPQPRGNAWAKARAEIQLAEWFGWPRPDFIITLSAPFAASVDDASFCALVDHELYHCAQALDDFGGPRFNRDTGRPIFAIKGHDVEEFVGVVRRWGKKAARVTELVDAALQPPEISAAAMVAACGTCEARVA